MKDIQRNAICMVVAYVILWYAGAMFNFFPFIANEQVIGAVGFAGLLVIIMIVICICRIIDTIRKSKLVPAVERLGQCDALRLYVTCCITAYA